MLVARHGVDDQAADAADRRAVTGPGADDRRPAARRRAQHPADGMTIVIVEQSVNVALDAGRTRRVHGEGRGALQRPDRASCSSGPTCCARCSSPVPRADAAEPQKPRGEDQAARRRQAEAPADADAPVLLESPRSGQALRRHPRRRRGRPRRCARARSSASSATTAPARPRCSTCISRLPAPPTRGRVVLGGARTSPSWPPHDRAPGRARPVVPGRAPVPVADRGRDDRRRPRAAPRRPGHAWRPRLQLPASYESELDGRRSGRRAHRAAWASSAFRDKLIGELSTGSRRIVELACVLAQDPSRADARRAVGWRRPARRPRRSARCCCGSASETGCSILVIEHDMPLLSRVVRPDGRPRARRRHRRGHARARCSTTRGSIESYLGTDAAAINRSGALV